MANIRLLLAKLELPGRFKAIPADGVPGLLRKLQQATRLVRRAEQAYRTGNRHAAMLHASAELAHYELLKRLCRATDEEAAIVEPAFTRFEEELLMLAKP